MQLSHVFFLEDIWNTYICCIIYSNCQITCLLYIYNYTFSFHIVRIFSRRFPTSLFPAAPNRLDFNLELLKVFFFPMSNSIKKWGTGIIHQKLGNWNHSLELSRHLFPISFNVFRLFQCFSYLFHRKIPKGSLHRREVRHELRVLRGPCRLKQLHRGHSPRGHRLCRGQHAEAGAFGFAGGLQTRGASGWGSMEIVVCWRIVVL